MTRATCTMYHALGGQPLPSAAERTCLSGVGRRAGSLDSKELTSQDDCPANGARRYRSTSGGSRERPLCKVLADAAGVLACFSHTTCPSTRTLISFSMAHGQHRNLRRYKGLGPTRHSLSLPCRLDHSITLRQAVCSLHFPSRVTHSFTRQTGISLNSPCITQTIDFSSTPWWLEIWSIPFFTLFREAHNRSCD